MYVCMQASMSVCACVWYKNTDECLCEPEGEGRFSRWGDTRHGQNQRGGFDDLNNQESSFHATKNHHEQSWQNTYDMLTGTALMVSVTLQLDKELHEKTDLNSLRKWLTHKPLTRRSGRANGCISILKVLRNQRIKRERTKTKGGLDVVKMVESRGGGSRSPHSQRENTSGINGYWEWKH